MIETATDLACKIVSRLVDDTDGPFMEFCIGEGERSNAEAAVRELLQQAMQDYDAGCSRTLQKWQREDPHWCVETLRRLADDLLPGAERDAGNGILDKWRIGRLTQQRLNVIAAANALAFQLESGAIFKSWLMGRVSSADSTELRLLGWVMSKWREVTGAKPDWVSETVVALRNCGVDVECGACMEVAFSGVTTNQHTCRPSPPRAVEVS